RTRRPSRAPAAHAAAPPVAVGELRSQRELYFRAGARSAPDLQFGADVPCALAHPRQAPMSRPPDPEHLRADTATIIAHAHFQSAVTVRNLHFDHVGAGVPESVREGLAAYEQELLARNRMKIARHPINRRPELRRVHEGKLFPGCSKRLRQFA